MLGEGTRRLLAIETAVAGSKTHRPGQIHLRVTPAVGEIADAAAGTAAVVVDVVVWMSINQRLAPVLVPTWRFGSAAQARRRVSFNVDLCEDVCASVCASVCCRPVPAELSWTLFSRCTSMWDKEDRENIRLHQPDLHQRGARAAAPADSFMLGQCSVRAVLCADQVDAAPVPDRTEQHQVHCPFCRRLRGTYCACACRNGPLQLQWRGFIHTQVKAASCVYCSSPPPQCGPSRYTQLILSSPFGPSHVPTRSG